VKNLLSLGTAELRIFDTRLPRALFIALVAFASAASALAQSATFTTQDYPFPGNSHVAADLNADGKVDLAGTGFDFAAVMLGNGNGTFLPKTNFAVAGQTQDIAAGDLSGDGKVDLAVTINTAQISLSLLTGTGTGSFNGPINFANTSGFDSPAEVTIDLNNDGKLDLVLAHQLGCFVPPCTAARTITVMLGNGDGTFQPAREIDIGTGMAKIAVGDFDRDGLRDLAIAGDQAQVYLLRGLGDGTFIQQPTIILVSGGRLGVDGTDISVADLNGDTLQDLVVSIGLNGSRTAVLLGNGNGTFGAPTIFTDAKLRVPQYNAVADYNLDGFADIALALADGTSGLIEILNGNGNGTFQAPIYYAVPPPLSSIGGGRLVTSDFNNDGKPDLALAVLGATPALKIFINSTNGPGITLAAVSLNPSTVVGGNNSTGTVTLSAIAQNTTVVSLKSNNSVATVPASVTVPAGAISANFTVSTTPVSVTTSALITATLGSVSRTATLTVVPVTADTVTITRAEYTTSKRSLRVEATSTRADATLQVFVTSTGQLIGTLGNKAGGKFGGQFRWSVNPVNITVRSNFGGQATRAVVVR